jgi:hypothetical protein
MGGRRTVGPKTFMEELPISRAPSLGWLRGHMTSVPEP